MLIIWDLQSSLVTNGMTLTLIACRSNLIADPHGLTGYLWRPCRG